MTEMKEIPPVEETEEERGGLSSIGDVATAEADRLEKLYGEMQARQEARILELGGPAAYVQEKAPRISSQYSGKVTLKLVMSDNEYAWTFAGERTEECARCPPKGGTCANSKDPGETIVIENEALGRGKCGKYVGYVLRKNMAFRGVPETLLDVSLDDLLEKNANYPLRVDLAKWIWKAIKHQKPFPLLLTGGHGWDRTQLMAAIMRNLCQDWPLFMNAHYTFGPRLAMQLKEYYKLHDQAGEADSPLYQCGKCDVLVIDNIDPRPPGKEEWKPWFIEAIDYMLWERISENKTTLMASRMSAKELAEFFDLSFMLPIAELSLDNPGFGPFKQR